MNATNPTHANPMSFTNNKKKMLSEKRVTPSIKHTVSVPNQKAPRLLLCALRKHPLCTKRDTRNKNREHTSIPFSVPVQKKKNRIKSLL